MICKNIYILKVYSIHCTLRQNPNVKKFLSDKINVTKNSLFLLWRASTHHKFTFNLQFLYELKHMGHLSKTVCGIFHFRFRLVFVKRYSFCSRKIVDSLTLKRHNSFQNKNNSKATHTIASRLLIFKLQQEILKFNDICMTVCNFQSMRSPVELNGLLSKFFCYITWFVISPNYTRLWTTCKQGLYVKSSCFFEILLFLWNSCLAV